MTNIAIVEDDRGLSTGITLALKREDYCFFQYYSLAEAGDLADMDLVILDIHLPDGNGMELLRSLRARSPVPVLILTASDSELDEVAGLEMGADDYMTKPFSLMVLRVRVEKLLGKRRQNAVCRFGNLRLDFARMEFFREEEPVELSRTEQRLLYILVENAGRTLQRERLLDYVWQDTDFIDENVLSVTVKRLRDKLETEEEKYIHTVYGIGYVWRLEKGGMRNEKSGEEPGV
ncbi:MAG: response regulator transcription factor [Muribaculaceae bacterium]|nr:response regulator transcription factor [Roseburia sp.]MCM1429804.1 response regulator transcription factor [Muribaculaceae bacterium]MCM1492855.1 response regulator transcription factor [Muribaculaceae bacterium]